MIANKPTFPGRLGLQQRVLPDYRSPFFELLAEACQGGMSLFAGAPRASEGIQPIYHLQVSKYVLAQNIHLFGGPLYLCYQRGLMDWLTTWDPQALIVEANPRYLSTPAAVKWMHQRGRKVIGWGLGSPIRSGVLSGFRQARRLQFISQFDALISYSQRGAQEYAALGFPTEKIHVAHNSVSHAPSFPLPRRPAAFRDRPYILFVGRLQTRKRVDLLLRACAALESLPRLVIVGDGPERQNLESLAKKVYPSAQFVGARHGAELKPFFTEADLFVLPGTGGLAVQEAMSYGLPVIVATGDGTQSDLVQEGNGWQIPSDDLPALNETLRKALSDVARLRRMGADSYRIAAEEINIEQMAAAFVQALNALTS